MTQQETLNILKTGANVFLTGQPGSGKTYVVKEYIGYLRSRGIEPAITASTGIAATHLGGLTIHSWSGLGIKENLSRRDLDELASKPYLKKRIRNTNILIIDEISMLPPFVLSLVDSICRKIKENNLPFGGLQVVLVGDFFQLPPVSRPQFGALKESNDSQFFSYSADIWREAQFVTCYLSEQYRQDDQTFLSLLKAIRRNQFNREDLAILLSRHTANNAEPDNIVKLFSHNFDVDNVNEAKLKTLKGVEKNYLMTGSGSKKMIEALKRGCLSPELLKLKLGAEVMFTKNNPGEGFYNGTLGRVVGFASSGRPLIKLRNNRQIEVSPMEWMIEEGGEIKAMIRQLPLRLAWAITVHKSQGLSLDEAVIDLSRVFEFGQGYVALSRLRRLAGLYLLGYNEMAFFVHPEVLRQDGLFVDESLKWQKKYAEIALADWRLLWDRFVIESGGCVEDLAVEKNNLTNNGQFATIKKNKKIKNKKGTHQETAELWLRGWSLDKIAKKRELTRGTILSHLEKAKIEGLFENKEIINLLDDSLKGSLNEIKGVFQRLKTDKLTPVFEELGGEYSYDELRIARLLLD